MMYTVMSTSLTDIEPSDQCGALHWPIAEGQILPYLALELLV